MDSTTHHPAAGNAVLAIVTLALALLIAAPAAAQVGFGAAAAVGDGEVFIGEPDNEIEPGAVYVYRAGAGGWTEVARLTRDEASEADGFGRAVAVDGDRLLVGADQVGEAYVFERRAGGWVQVAVLDAGDGADGTPAAPAADRFGAAVALSGDRALVGAPGARGGAGAAWVFEAAAGGWRMAAELDGGEEDAAGFGAAVDLDGDRALVGAPGAVADLFLIGALGLSRPNGRAWVFERRGGGWSRAATLEPVMAGDGAIFGFDVALAGERAAVSAVGESNLTGAVHRFALDAGEQGWAWQGKLVPFDAVPGGFFGAAIALAGDEMLVGAPGVDDLEGRVYRFRHDAAGEWSEVAKVDSDALAWGTGYGSSVAARGDVAVAGLPGVDFGAGGAAILRRSEGGWSAAVVKSEARGLDPVVGAPVPCVDGRAGIFECENVTLVSFLPVRAMGGGRGVTTNDLWGWTDPETGRDYVVVGLRDGTAFVDVSEPATPVFVGKLPKPEQSPPSLWRDIKVHNNHAFIVADASGQHGMQVFDLTRLREFAGEPITFGEDAHYDRLASSHNLAINPDSAFAYAVGSSSGGESCGGGLHMINVEDPRNPVFVGCFQDTRTGQRGTGQSHDVQCVDYHGPDERYRGREICFGSNETALSIADVTDKRDPVAVAMATYPNVTYTHQGWLDEEHRYFYMNDEGDEVAGVVPGTRTLVWDVQELDDPIMVAEYVSESPATDHNLYIVGDVMYQSNYRSGLRVFDISDRESPRPIGYFDTVPWGSNAGMGNILTGAIGSWSNFPFFEGGIVVVASGKEGVFVLRLDDDARPGAGPR